MRPFILTILLGFIGLFLPPVIASAQNPVPVERQWQVDAHRTVGLVISPYIKRKSVDHTFYTTSSFLRSMELLLGLPPMTQYDAGATPLFSSFSDRADLTPFRVLEPRTDLAAINARPIKTATRKAASKLDFSAYDRCDPDTLNRVLWQAVKGSQTPYPGPTIGARLAGR